MKPYTGRAVVFTEPRHAEVHDGIAFPEMDDDGVVIRTQHSVISRGTELDLYTSQMHGRGDNAQWYPMLPGYLPCGEVIEIGANVTHLAKGDLATASNLITGFDARYCCAWGGHCEYTVVSVHSHPEGARRAVRVPTEVHPRYAPLAVLGAVALHGIQRKVRPEKGETVLVVGQGVIGNFAAQLCKLAGARIIVADLEESRLAVSRACGIEEAVNARDKPLQDTVERLTDGCGPDIAIDVTGEPRALESLLRIVRPGGRIHAQGMYLEPVSIYFPETMFSRHLTLSATCGESPEQVAEVLTEMASGRLLYEPLLTTERPVDTATATYEWVHNHPDEVMTVGFEWP